MISDHNGKKFGMIFDLVLKKEKLVEKEISFEQNFLKTSIDNSYFSGVSVLGDGEIGHVLNVSSIFQRVFIKDAV